MHLCGQRGKHLSYTEYNSLPLLHLSSCLIGFWQLEKNKTNVYLEYIQVIFWGRLRKKKKKERKEICVNHKSVSIRCLSYLGVRMWSILKWDDAHIRSLCFEVSWKQNDSCRKILGLEYTIQCNRIWPYTPMVPGLGISKEILCRGDNGTRHIPNDTYNSSSNWNTL